MGFVGKPLAGSGKVRLNQGFNGRRSGARRTPALIRETGNMAAEGEIEKEAVVHRKGYEGFLFLMKWGAIISMVLGFIVVLLIRE
jgi:hypothetical protein